ncbi:hypothetical protein D9M71_604620 [compost metagenome]
MDARTKLDCCDKILDMCDPESVAELARLEAFDALECLKELARTDTDPEVRREAAQKVEQADRARQAYIRRKGDQS